MARSASTDPLLAHNFALLDIPVAGLLPTAFPIKTVQNAVSNSAFVGFRSLKEMMGIASEYVEVPPALEARGMVPPPRYTQTGLQRIPFKVRSSTEEPQGTPYKVSLHDHWFWIDMSDHKSKALLEALNSLFYSQLGASQPGDPILTLPLSPPRP